MDIKGGYKMNYFTPRRFPSLTVWFYASPEQKQTFEDPGFPIEIDFGDIEINGESIDDNLYAFLLDALADDWENEIQELRF